MLATTLPFDLPLPLSEVFILLLMSAVLGLAIYAVVDFITTPPAKKEKPNREEKPKRSPEPRPPLDATGWTLAVDGSNFAHRGDDVRLEHLQEVLDALRKRFDNAKLRVFCDANLRYKFQGIDQRIFLRRLDRPNSIFSETHGTTADEVLLKFAQDDSQCIVVSNDRFAKDEEISLRIGVPLLKVRISGSTVRPADKIAIFTDETQPFDRTSIPVGHFIGS